MVPRCVCVCVCVCVECIIERVCLFFNCPMSCCERCTYLATAHIHTIDRYLTFDILRRIMEDYFGYEVGACPMISDLRSRGPLRVV